VKFKFLLRLSLILLFNFTFLSCAERIDKTLENGIVDISQMELNSSDIININGDWIFFWDQIPVNEKSEFDLSKLRVIDSIHSENGSWSSKNYPAKGYGTYFIDIILPKDSYCKHLKIPYVHSSVRVWVNGGEQKGIGSFSKKEVIEFPDKRPLYLDLECYGHAYITILVSNYHYKSGGGFPAGAFLTTAKNMETHKEVYSIVPTILAIIVLLISLYHIFLYVSNKNTSMLFFALFMISLFSRNLFIGEIPIYTFFPDISYVVVQQLSYSTLYLALIFFTIHLNKINLKQRFDYIRFVPITINGTALISVIFSPSFSSIHIELINYIVFSITGLYFFYLLVFKTNKKNENNNFNSLLVILVVFTYLLIQIQPVKYSFNTDNLVLLLLLCLIYEQLKVSYHYWKSSLRKMVKLSSEVTELNQSIKIGKEERTVLLSESIQQLHTKQELVKKLVDIKKDTNVQSLNSVIAELRSTKLEESRKLILKQNVEDLNFEFLKRLKEKHSDLTTTDIEICSLIKLGFSSQEICNLRSTTKFALKSSRYRLRKKFKLNPEESLRQYLRNI